MLWAISRVCKPNTAEARDAGVEAHREWLKSQKRILVLSGAQFSDDGTDQIGSLLIVNVNSRAEAQAFVDADPFMQAGLFSNVKITRMRKGQWNPEAAEGA
jgi:uncharacterized protein YciI